MTITDYQPRRLDGASQADCEVTRVWLLVDKRGHVIASITDGLGWIARAREAERVAIFELLKRKGRLGSSRGNRLVVIWVESSSSKASADTPRGLCLPRQDIDGVINNPQSSH
jgi:hypothetical protein